MATDAMKSNVKLGAVLAGFVTIAGWAWTISERASEAAADKARLEGRVESIQATAGDHETRLRSIENGMAEMRSDVKWIRQTLERREYGRKSEE